MAKKRLDDVLIERGLATNKQECFIVVTEGSIFVDGQKAISPAQMVSSDATIEIRRGPEMVGRGAYKLQGALDAFELNVEGRVCADIGAATGGFTQILLKRGAQKVYAIDTARGKLALKLRQDPRVIVMEGTDVRDIASLPEKINLAVMDVSLISIRDILPAVRRFLKPEGRVVALFKPQYETRDPRILHRGVIRDLAIGKQLFDEFMVWTVEHGWRIGQWIESPIRGGKGNKEYLVLLASSREIITRSEATR